MPDFLVPRLWTRQRTGGVIYAVRSAHAGIAMAEVVHRGHPRGLFKMALIYRESLL